MARIKRPKAKKTMASALPQQVTQLIMQAQAMRAEGQFLQAIPLLQQAENLAPKAHPVLLSLAATFQALNYTQDALTYARQALQIKPGDMQSYKVLGAALIDNDQHQDAADTLIKAWSRDKSDPQILRLLARALCAIDKHADALKQLTAYKDLHHHADLLDITCDAYRNQHQEHKAVTLMETARTHYPDNPFYLSLTATAYAHAGDYAHEYNYAQQAHDLAPDDIKIACDYAVALTHQSLFDKAIALYDALIQKHPESRAIFLVNKAALLKSMHQLDKAKNAADEAIHIAPNMPDAHYTLGQINQLRRDYLNSWTETEWHWHVSARAKFRPTNSLPLWYGDDDLNHKTLLIFEDQGVGDTLLFSRFLPEVKKQYPDCNLILMVEAKMAAIFELSFGHLCQIVVKQESADAVIKADFMCAISTLPMALRTTIHTLPPCPTLTTKRELYYKQSDDDLVIGITWRTSNIVVGQKRSVNLTDFQALAAIPGVRLVDLQYGDTAEDRAACGFDIIHDETVDPYKDMQAHIDQINACDLVISIDNTTVHAAGTLDKPVWVLLPYDCYWRAFHHDGDATPWYPSMRLFRQDETHDFIPVIATIVEQVQQLASGQKNHLENPTQPALPAVIAKNKKTQALLLNDTSDWYHWGCNATSGAIIAQLEGKNYAVTSASFMEVSHSKMPPPALTDFDDPLYRSAYMYAQPSLFDKIRHCDTLVINGEGTIHSLNVNALRLLYLAYIAKTFFNKTVHLINHACFPQSSTELSDPAIIAYYRKAYLALDDIAVRDPLSHDLLNKLEIPNRLAFDSLPLKAQEFLRATESNTPRSKTIILAGSSKFSSHALPALKRMLSLIHDAGYYPAILSGAAVHESDDDFQFIETLKQATDTDIKQIKATSLDEWFTHLHQSPLLISGRFHYTIAAAALGTPFIAFEGNTPKLHALSTFLDTPPPLSYSDPNLTASLSVRMHKIMDNLPQKTAGAGEKIKEMCALAAQNYTDL